MHRRNAAVYSLSVAVLAIGTVVFGLWGPLVAGAPSIWTTGDGWTVIHPARYVASGAFPYLYSPYYAMEANWPYPPGLPMLFAPVAWIIDHFALLANEPPTYVPNPSGWLVFAPALVLAGATLAPVVGALTRRLGARWDVSAALLVVPAGGFSATIVYGHAEDLVALAALVGAVLAALDARWRRVGILLGVGLLFKQWAFVLVPLLVAAAPSAMRRSVLAWAVSLPAAPIVVCLVYDPENTVRALTGARSAPVLGHTYPWIASSSTFLTAAPMRILGLAVLAILGWFWGRRCRGGALVAAAGGLMALRLASEPVLFSYYVVQIAPFILVLTAVRCSRVMLWAQGLGLAALTLWFAQHPSPWIWWPVAAALAAPSAVVLFQARHRSAPLVEGTLVIERCARDRGVEVESPEVGTVS